MGMTVLDEGDAILLKVVMLSLGTRMCRLVTPWIAMAAPRPTGPDACRERKVRL